MPLSDREQRILQDIEARLRQEDPKFARQVGTITVTSQIRWRIKLAVAGFVLGLLLLLSIVPFQSILPGIAGFVVMLGSVVLGGNQLKRLGQDQGNLGGQLRGGFTRYLDDKRGKGGDPKR